MATHFVDPTNGLDSNSGLTYALRKKTITSVTTAVAGDLIKVAKDPDPTLVVSGTWTNLSNALTLASAVTAIIDTCEVAWTASVNVTATTTTTAKAGTNAASLAIATAFTTGKVAYRTISSTDFSGYQQVSLWMRSSLAMATGRFQIKLCSDTTGDTPVDTLQVDVNLRANTWKAITIDKGSALGAAIQSVAVYAIVDPAVTTLLLDNIIACKAVGSADSLTHMSMVGKNNGGAVETWYPIQSINDTAVILGAGINLAVGDAGLRGYFGTTETADVYKRTPHLVVENGSSTTSSWGAFATDGTEASPITISGGWDPADSMVTQNSDSWITANAATDIGLKLTGADWVNISKLNFTRTRFGVWFNTSSNSSIADCELNGNNEYGLYCDGISGKATFTNIIAHLNGTVGVSTTYNSKGGDLTCHGNGLYGVLVIGGDNVLRTVTCRKNGVSGLDFYFYANSCVYDLTTSDNEVSAVHGNAGRNFLIRATTSEALDFSPGTGTLYFNPRVFCQDWNGTGNYRVLFAGGTVFSDTGGDREKTSGPAWKISVTDALRNSTYPIEFGEQTSGGGVKIQCAANLLVTVSARVKRDNTGITLSMVCPGGQIAGVPADVVATAAALAGTYETITLSFTPTAAGVVDIIFKAYGGTTYSAWIDRLNALIQS